MEEQIVGTKAWAFWRRNRRVLDVSYGIQFPLTAMEWRARYPNEADCPVCHGANGRNIKAMDGSVYQCVCLMPAWSDEQRRLRSMYQSRFEPVDFSQTDARLGEKNARNLSDALIAATNFTDYLGSWLVLSGPYGVGKSFIAKAITQTLKPIALFITATDFERMIFEHLNSNTLEELVLRVSQAPVLVFDDFGAEYGSDIVKSQIAAIFIARDHQAKDLPTVVTTNLTREGIARVPRVGSRLLNEDTSLFLPINMADYRTRNYREMHPEERAKW